MLTLGDATHWQNWAVHFFYPANGKSILAVEISPF
jgi:hypothetical protein